MLRLYWKSVLVKSTFIPTYYVRSENVWQDGFLFDFLQKKTADAWIRRFVIYTGFLLSERLVFDSVVRLYIDNLVWVGHHNSIFEVTDVSSALSTTLYLYAAFFFLLAGGFFVM